MSDEAPLEEIASEPNWVEIDPPKEDDDEYTLGYFKGREIRVSSDNGTDVEAMMEVSSGPYKITIIPDGDTRMIFVERQRIEDQNRQIPTGRMTAYSNQITFTIPEQIVESESIATGDRYRAGIHVESGHMVIRLNDSGPLAVSVSESFNREQMEHEYEVRLGKVVGEVIGIEDFEEYCKWFPTEDDGFEIETGIRLDTPDISESEVRDRDPVKVFFDASNGISHYSLTVEKDHPAIGEVEGNRGLRFELASYRGETVLKAIDDEHPAGNDFSRAVIEHDDEIEFGIPERVGDILELYDRAWVRLFWDDEEEVLYGLPCETYGPAPLLK